MISTWIQTLKKGTKERTLCLILLIVFLTLISGFRVDHTIDSDEWNYRQLFNSYKNISMKNIGFSLFREPGFKFIVWLLAHRGFEDQSLIFVAAAFTVSVFVWFLNKYSIDFELAIYIFVAGGSFFSTMNILRQYIAIAIILLGYKWIIKNKIVRFIPYILVASLFHVSALFTFVYFFFLQIRRMERTFILISVVLMVFIINFSKIILIFESTTYNEYTDLVNGYGTGWERILFWGGLALFVYLERKLIDPEGKIPRQIKNGYILSTVILFASKVYVYIARCDYMGICQDIILAELPNAFTINSRRFAKIFLMIVFFAYGYYQVVYVGGYSNMDNLLFRFI